MLEAAEKRQRVGPARGVCDRERRNAAVKRNGGGRGGRTDRPGVGGTGQREGKGEPPRQNFSPLPPKPDPARTVSIFRGTVRVRASITITRPRAPRLPG